MPLDDMSFNKISKLVNDYNAKIKSIRDDDNLSGIGKQRALAKLYVGYRDEIAGVRQKANDAYQDRKGYLMGEVFGYHGTSDPNMALSMRDAMTRAAAVDSPKQARQLFQQAHLTGDEPLRRAIAAHAFSQRGDSDLGDHWASLFNEYLGTQDERRQGLVAELDHLHQADSKRARFQEQILCGISRPSELDGHGNIDAIATGAVEIGDDTAGAA